MNYVANEITLSGQIIAVRSDNDDLAVGGHDLELANMVCCGAVSGCVRTTGVIGNHSPQGRPRTRCHVRSKPIPVRTKKTVDLIKNDAWADANRPALKIQIGYLPNIPRAVNDQTIANRSADQARAG